MAIATRSGNANLAAIAYGTAGPIVAKLPDSEPFMPRRICRWRASQLVAVPASPLKTTSSGKRFDSSVKTSSGFSGSADTCDVDASIFAQASRFARIVLRHSASPFCFSNGNSASSVCLASPARFTSIG